MSLVARPAISVEVLRPVEVAMPSTVIPNFDPLVTAGTTEGMTQILTGEAFNPISIGSSDSETTETVFEEEILALLAASFQNDVSVGTAVAIPQGIDLNHAPVAVAEGEQIPTIVPRVTQFLAAQSLLPQSPDAPQEFSAHAPTAESAPANVLSARPIASLIPESLRSWETDVPIERQLQDLLSATGSSAAPPVVQGTRPKETESLDEATATTGRIRSIGAAVRSGFDAESELDSVKMPSALHGIHDSASELRAPESHAAEIPQQTTSVDSLAGNPEQFESGDSGHSDSSPVVHTDSFNPGSVPQSALVPASPQTGPVSPKGDHIAEQIADSLFEHAEVVKHKGEHRFTMRLDPPELGQLEIEMEHTEGRLAIRINAADPVSFRFIQATVDELSANLHQQDSVFHEVNIDITTGGDSNQPDRDESQWRQQNQSFEDIPEAQEEQAGIVSFMA